MEAVTPVTDTEVIAAQVFFDQGNALCKQGRLSEGIHCYRQALTLQPEYAEVYNNLGIALQSLGETETAISCYLHAIKFKPDYADAQSNLGHLYLTRHQYTEAINLFKQVLHENPENILSRLGLANSLLLQGSYEDAVPEYEQVICLDENNTEALNNLGIALQASGKLDDAIRAFRRVLEINPDNAEGYISLGIALRSAENYSDSIASFQQACKLRPEHPGIYNNIGRTCLSQGKISEAIKYLRKALAIKPDFHEAHSSLIFTMDLDVDCNVAMQQMERKRWAEVNASRFMKDIQMHGNDPDPERQLRIGYISADFHRHSAAYAFGPVLLNYDPLQFEVICYSGVTEEDNITEQFKEKASGWRGINDMTDDDLAQKIRDDEIDILVDLSGYTEGHRLLVFARKPAPVQVSGLGNGAGTGLAVMDYLFSDPVSIPAEEAHHFAEEIVNLPYRLGYQPPPKIPPVQALPALSKGYITFGCLNNLMKVSDQALALWAEIIREVPDSRLLLKGTLLNDMEIRSGFLKKLLGLGMKEDSIQLLGGSPQWEHLEVYHQVDIALDPFPYGGGISTYESLCMGVPVITLHGQTLTGRGTSAILQANGLDNYVAMDKEEYLCLAIRYSGDLEYLANKRQELRQQVQDSEAGNPVKYTRAVERAYREMWKKWCQGRS